MQYKIIRMADYSLQAFCEQMSADHPRLLSAIGDAAGRLDADTVIRSVVYHYSSLDECQQPIVMSALMLMPMLRGKLAATALWLENRATQSADKDVPTHHWNIGEAHVLNRHVLVSPDLMSFGASIDKPICYCHAELAARNTVDAVVAAQKLLMEEGLIDVPFPVYNSGHSQGGFDALAVHRYMETQATEDERRLFPLVKTYCADGPYALDVQTVVTASKEKYIYGAYMLMSAMSHLHYHRECFDDDVQIGDFLTAEARELGLAETIARKDTGNKELVKIAAEALGFKLSAMFLPDVYQPDGRLYGMMMACSMKDRLIDGWTPEKPIYFYHAHYDECVPVECMQAAEAVWGNLPNVTFEDDLTAAEDIEKRMVHAYSGGVFHRRLLKGEIK